MPTGTQWPSSDIVADVAAGAPPINLSGVGGAGALTRSMSGVGGSGPWGSLPGMSVFSPPSIQMGALGRGLPAGGYMTGAGGAAANPYGSLDPSLFNSGLNPFSNVKMGFNPAGPGVSTAALPKPVPAGYPANWNGVDSLEVANDRNYLIQTSPAHSAALSRPGDFADMNPDMVVNSANAIREARASGMPDVGIFSGARPPGATGGAGAAGQFDMNGYLMHPVGLAADFHGIGEAGSAQSHQWNDIATRNGLYGPYGPDSAKEWNHYQDVPDRNLDRSGAAEKYYWDQNRSPSHDKAMWGDENKEFGLPDRGLNANSVDMSPTGSIAISAQKAANDAAQKAMQTSTENLKSFTTGVTDVGKQSLQSVPDMNQFGSSIQSMVSKLSEGGGGGGGGGLGGLFGGGGGFGGGSLGGVGDDMIGLGGLFHEGGLVGNDNAPSRAVPSILFSRATRFHDGLGDDEFPAILQRGERVLTANQDMRATALMSRMADMVANQSTPAGTQNVGRGPTPHMTMIVNTPNASSFRYSQSQIMAQTQAAMQRIGKKHN